MTIDTEFIVKFPGLSLERVISVSTSLIYSKLTSLVVYYRLELVY